MRPGPKSHRAPTPASADQRRNLPPHPPISNRHWMRLEIAATSTKHSLDLISNRHKNTVSWGRHSCEFAANPQIHTEECQWHDEVPHPFLNGVGTTSTRRVAQAGVGLCVVASPLLTSSRGPFTGRRISLPPSSPASTRTTACAAGCFTHAATPASSSSCKRDPQLARVFKTVGAEWSANRRRSNAMLSAAATNGGSAIQRNARAGRFEFAARASLNAFAVRECAETRLTPQVSRASTVITDSAKLSETARQHHCVCSGAFIHYAQFRLSSVRIGGFFRTTTRGVGVAFVRRKGNTYFLVHNVRRQGKVRQLHLARLGERPKITDDVVRSVTRNHPFLQLDWSSLREQVNNRAPVFDVRSPYVQTLMHALRNLNLDLADLTPPMLLLAGRANSSRELVTQLRLLRATLDIKLGQFERGDLAVANGGRKFR